MRAVRAGKHARIGLAAAAASALMLAGVWGTPAPGGAAGSGKALVRGTPAVEQLAAIGRLEILERYEGRDGEATLLVRTDGATLGSIGRGPGRAHRRGVPDRIHLRRRTIDTSAGRAAAPALGPSPGRLEIVQFHGPIRPEWLADLRARGAGRPVAYLPHNAYIVWVDDPAAMSAARLPLQWREELSPEDRLDPALAGSAGPVDVTVQVAHVGRHDAMIDRIRAMALSVLMEPRRFGPVTNFRVRLPAGAVELLAAEPEVTWIEAYAPPVTHDERSAMVVAGQVLLSRPRPPAYMEWLESRGLASLGHIIVDVTDTGIDRGAISPTHPGLQGRLAYSLNRSIEAGIEDCTGHGTNVAGILAGAPSPGNELVDPEGYLVGLGVAPSIRVGSTKVFECAGQFSPSVPFTDLVAGAWELGARIGNNSWGGLGVQYNTITAEYDALVRDANRDPRDGDQGFLPVFSAGNQGPSPYSIGWPATAKNVLTVGATENYRPATTDGCGTSSLFADNVDHALLLSSRGPTGDGRLKPDIVAPGSHIQSLASGAVEYNGVGVCDAHFPPGQQVVNWSTGTSQAAPHATGAAAIAFEIFHRRFGSDPSPAMMKAMLINHAHDMGTTPSTPSNTNHRPNADQGWGRLDIGSLADERATFASDQAFVLTGTGESVRFEPLVPADPGRPVVVTLVWTDAPGPSGGWAFVNDLDLVVEAGGATYLGNVIANGVSTTGGESDFRNNVEAVILPAGSPLLSVQVEAANIAGDGLPSLPGETDQDFALYVSNAIRPADEGVIEMPGGGPVCGAGLKLRLADLGLRGFGLASVRLESGSDAETVRLQEAFSASGVFEGVIDVTGGPAVASDGVLQVADSAIVRAAYLDADASGSVVERTAASAASCAPPVIADLRVTRIGDTQATVEWTTDRPATSEVFYGPGSSRTATVTDPAPVTRHRVKLQGLPTCRFHTATVASVGPGGVRAEWAGPPLEFATGGGPNRRRTVFFDDMESLGSAWTHAALAGGIDDWELGAPATGPPGAFSGRRAWGTNLDGSYSPGADAVLVSPPIDLRDAVSPQLSLQHFHQINGGRTPDSANDGGWVEVSADGGETWATVGLPTAYPDTIDPDNPHIPDSQRVFAGITAGWSKVTFDLAPYGGSVIRVRFHIWQDRDEGGPLAAGWYIDDVLVTAQGSCHEGRVRLDSGEFGCSSRVTVVLSDSDLDLNPGAVEQVQLPISTAAQQAIVPLTETAAGSGEFRGALDLRASAAPGALAVAEGETITVLYEDQNAGGGRPAVASDSAVVSDCAPPPAPTGVKLLPAGTGLLNVIWDPVDPAAAPDLQGYRVHYDTDGPGPVYSGTGAFQGASPVRMEASAKSLPLGALVSCAPHFVTVTAFDRLGNESAFAAEAVDVPSGGAACAFGRLTVSPQRAGCLQSLQLTVLDGNADPAAATAGTVLISASGPSHQGSVVATLTETSGASGVFYGTLPLSPAPVPGALTVSQDDLVTLLYTDADDGLGRSRPVSARAEIGDCTAPVVQDVLVTGRASDRATIRWSTDEPASSHVHYGLDASLGTTVSVPGQRTQHSVPIRGLAACTPVWFRVASDDAAGNQTIEPSGAPPFQFGSFRDVPTFQDDLESGAPGWSHAALGATPDEWELGTPVGSGAPAPPSGAGVWGTDLDGRYEKGADLVLITPPIDISRGEAATLSFSHWYDIESIGGPPGGFDDGAFLEVSVDDGASWAYITPLGSAPCAPGSQGCYPDAIAPNPYVPFGAGGFSGSSGGWLRSSFVLDDFVGQVIRIRFHLLQDKSDPTVFRQGLGWYLDDVLVTFAVACREGRLEMDRAEYGCGGSVVKLQLSDVDLDLDPGAVDTTSVRVASAAEPAGETVPMIETGLSSGTFTGQIGVSASDDAGVLAVADGDSIVAVYEDQDDGSGVPRQVEAVARVSDCRAPVISDVRLSRLSPGFFTVEWRTSEPADSRVLYGSVPALGSVVSSPDLTTVHAVTVTGIAPCTRTFFTVASSDALGNLAREDDTSGLRTLDTPSDSAIYLENFDTGAAGWSHSGQDDLWEFTQPSSGPSTGTPVASTGPGGPIVRPPLDINSDFALLSPPINLEGIQNPKLSFRHRYDFTFSAQGGDGGWIEAWDGAAWVIIAPVGGYPALLDVEAGRTGVRPLGYSGTLPAFADAVFDLSGLLRPGAAITRFRFRVFVDGGTGPTGSGWRIDDVSVSGTLACREGRLAFERQSGACGTSSLPLSLHDLDLDLDPSSPDTAMVQVSSTGGPGPMTLVMTEAAASVGLLRGSVPLSEDGAPGTLRALPGDLLTALYEDADDGSGASAARTATFTAGACSGPAIHRVQLEPVGADSVIGRWSTDQPSIGALSLSSGSGQVLTGGDLRMGTSHQVTIRGLDPCTLYSGTIWSENGDGIRSTVSGPAGALLVETVQTDRVFFDDAEGPDPGWQVAGLVPEWQRGVPTFGPDTAFSGQHVIATDLGGLYDGGANATLISPPIDLTGAPNPRLGFWHWYDIFASGPPLSFDDAAWVEVQDVKTGTIQYIEPVGGYTDVTDQEGGDPLHLGTPVYAGVSDDWERAVFDLSPYAGKVVRVRFRIWNDLVELLLNQHTGAGWYLDDVEVSAPEYCFPAPILEPQGPLVLPQGASLVGIQADGSGFREGAVASSGPGVRISNVSIVSSNFVRFDITAEPGAPLGAHDLIFTNPDGQSAVATGAIRVSFDPVRADINGSGRVDAGDLILFASAFGSFEGHPHYRTQADLNRDGAVDGVDLALLASAFGTDF